MASTRELLGPARAGSVVRWQGGYSRGVATSTGVIALLMCRYSAAGPAAPGAAGANGVDVGVRGD